MSTATTAPAIELILAWDDAMVRAEFDALMDFAWPGDPRPRRSSGPDP